MSCKILTTPQFAKEVKKLSKKFKSIKKDLSLFIERLPRSAWECIRELDLKNMLQ